MTRHRTIAALFLLAILAAGCGSRAKPAPPASAASAAAGVVPAVPVNGTATQQNQAIIKGAESRDAYIHSNGLPGEGRKR